MARKPLQGRVARLVMGLNNRKMPLRVMHTSAPWGLASIMALMLVFSGIVLTILAVVMFALLPTLTTYHAIILSCMGIGLYMLGHLLLVLLPDKKTVAGVMSDKQLFAAKSNRAGDGHFSLVTFRQFSDRLHKP